MRGDRKTTARCASRAHKSTHSAVPFAEERQQAHTQSAGTQCTVKPSRLYRPAAGAVPGALRAERRRRTPLAHSGNGRPCGQGQGALLRHTASGTPSRCHGAAAPPSSSSNTAGHGGGAWWRVMVAGHGGSSPAAALAAFSRRTTALGQSPPHCRAATAAWSYKGADNTGGGGQSQRCMGLAGLRAQGGLSGTNCQSRFALAKFIRKFEGGSPTTMARQRLWTMGKAGLHKRAGTSPVNAVVREMIMKRQVHVQSSD